MSAAVLRGLGADLTPIGLAELVERAALQTRVDRKYVIPLAEVPALLADVAERARILEIDGSRSFRYESVYFDTPELTSYRLTAYRRRRRFKVRTRTYLDSDECWLEVKTQGSRGSTVKHRVPYLPHHRTDLDPGRQFVDEVLEQERFTAEERLLFAPSLCSRYRRSTLFLPGTASRVTIDTELTWDDGRRELATPALAVIETKASGGACEADRLLWRAGHRPTRISKYATGLAALRPDLPATPWRRTLRRHFSTDPTAVAVAPAARARRFAADPATSPRPFAWPQAS